MTRRTFTSDKIARPVGPFAPAAAGGDAIYLSAVLAAAAEEDYSPGAERRTPCRLDADPQ
jgi:hypothetical protein